MENHNKLLLEGLSDRGHEIKVISTRHPSGVEYERKGNIHLYYLLSTKFGSVRKGWKKESQKKFIALNKKDKFDIICSQQPIFPPIPRDVRACTPLVTLIQAHEAWVFLSEINQFLSLKCNVKSFIKNTLSFIYHYVRWELYNFRRSDVIIVPAHEVARSLKWWFLIGSNKIRTIYNGVDIKHLRPDKKASERIIDIYPQLSGKRVILFLSHVTRQKGLHLLIKVFSSLVAREHDLILMVVGDGDYLEEAKRLSIQMGVSDRIIFFGMVDNGSVQDYINSADIFVLPTLRQEGLPLSILEAMACKKPVITTNIGGNASVVKNGLNGILVPPGDICKLGENISILLHDKDLAGRLAENGYLSVIKKFSLDKMLDNYERLMINQINIKSSN